MIAYEVAQEQEEPGRSVARNGTGESKDVRSVPDRKIHCQLEFQEILLFGSRETERNAGRKARLTSDKRLGMRQSHKGAVYR